MVRMQLAAGYAADVSLGRGTYARHGVRVAVGVTYRNAWTARAAFVLQHSPESGVLADRISRDLWGVTLDTGPAFNFTPSLALIPTASFARTRVVASLRNGIAEQSERTDEHALGLGARLGWIFGRWSLELCFRGQWTIDPHQIQRGTTVLTKTGPLSLGFDAGTSFGF